MVAVEYAVRAGGRGREPGVGQRLDEVREGLLGGADVSDNVRVLTDLRGYAPVLQGVQENHLSADEGPRCR